ncbi:hypothetical protein HK405_014697, partial [Cladochytrium tenue]
MAAPAPAAAAAPPEPAPLAKFLSTQLAAAEPSVPAQLAPVIAFVHRLVGHIDTAERRAGAVPALAQLRASAGVPPFAVVVAAALLVLAAARRAIKANAPLVSNAVGAVYPGIRSILAVERPKQDDDE